MITEDIQEKQKVLIVDDVPGNIVTLGEALKAEHQVVVAKTGKRAIAIANDVDPPDLILLDIIMPGMDGFEVLKILKDSDSTKNIPIIFISSMGESQTEAKGLVMGAVDYITKPFNIPIAKARISTHLRMKKKSDMLESLASLDGLTDIPNRRLFDKTFDSEWRRAMRKERQIALAIGDIDFFKNFNDTYGHSTGDICLQKVATALKKSLRRSCDFLARYGGEEFGIILPDCSIDEAEKTIEQLRQAVEALCFTSTSGQDELKVTMSFGVSSIRPATDDKSETLFEAADRQLYEAKEDGRNCVKTEQIS